MAPFAIVTRSWDAHEKLASRARAPASDEVVAASVARKSEGGSDGRIEASARIVATRIVFTRRIKEASVVGAGGKLIVTLANDGSVLGFSYDWPRYVPRSTVQTMLPAGDLLRRVQRVVASATEPRLVPPGDRPFPFELTSTATLESFECGYVDSADPTRGDSPAIQPGCSYRGLRITKLPSGAIARSGFAGAISGGVTFERDGRWAEAALLSGYSPPEAPQGSMPRTP